MEPLPQVIILVVRQEVQEEVLVTVTFVGATGIGGLVLQTKDTTVVVLLPTGVQAGVVVLLK